MTHLADTTEGRDEQLGGTVVDYAEDQWPTICERCGATAPPGTGRVSGGAERHILRKTLYATLDRAWVGMPGPGDMYFADWFEIRGASGRTCIHGWTNCDGRHLMVVLPNDRAWDTGGRASNCDKHQDTTHRCWVRHGDPRKGEIVHVDKAGETCNAGSGSIDAGGWHGFLHHGELKSC